MTTIKVCLGRDGSYSVSLEKAKTLGAPQCFGFTTQSKYDMVNGLTSIQRELIADFGLQPILEMYRRLDSLEFEGTLTEVKTTSVCQA
jgi:hypothetical protein